MPKISVIVPAYNAEATIAKAISSVLSQDYDNFELIIIDDGSSDNTFAIIKQFESQDCRIRVFHKENGGQSSARNVGLKNCRGDWVLFLDADDCYCEYAFRTLIDNTSENIDLVLFGFNVYRNEQLLRTPNPGSIEFKNSDVDAFSKIMWLLASPCNKLYRRGYIKTLFDESAVHGEDSRFNYQNLTAESHIKAIPNCLYNVCLDIGNSVNKICRKGRLIDCVKNSVVKYERLNQIFNNDSLNKKVFSEAISTVVFTICLCATNFTHRDFIEEINQSLQYLGPFSADENVKCRLRPDQKLIWHLFSNARLNQLWFSTKTICSILNVIRWLKSHG